MKIIDFLNDKAVTVTLTARTKEGVIRELVDKLYQAHAIKDTEKIMHVILDRESLGSTGIGQGVAIPHGKSALVKELVIAFGISAAGVNFDSLDGEPVYIIFLLLAPEHSAGPHLKALARISRLLQDRNFREALRGAADDKTLLKIIKQEDAVK